MYICIYACKCDAAANDAECYCDAASADAVAAAFYFQLGSLQFDA